MPAKYSPRAGPRERERLLDRLERRGGIPRPRQHEEAKSSFSDRASSAERTNVRFHSPMGAARLVRQPARDNQLAARPGRAAPTFTSLTRSPRPGDRDDLLGRRRARRRVLHGDADGVVARLGEDMVDLASGAGLTVSEVPRDGDGKVDRRCVARNQMEETGITVSGSTVMAARKSAVAAPPLAQAGRTSAGRRRARPRRRPSARASTPPSADAGEARECDVHDARP
jgi:hypothetical protein